VTGEFIDVVEGPSKGGTDGSSLVVGPDGKLYETTGFGASSVRRIDISTGEVSTFVPSFSGGLAFAAGLLFAPQLCDHLGEYGPCAEGAGTRCKAEAVREVGRVVTRLTQVNVLECGAADGGGGFQITPDCPAGYSYCVENRNDGVGNSVKLGIVEPQAIGGLVALSPVETTFDPMPVSGGPAGTFTITATFTNTSSTPIHHLLFRVAQLSGGNLLLNADGGPGGVGALLTPDVGSDVILSPNESFTTAFVIGLHLRRQFTFFVDLLGVPEP
jgi:hypothetical protein